jgi:hypothetical protein
MDDPPDGSTVHEAKQISIACGFEDKTKIITVGKNPQHRFHQAWVRREGYRRAKHDRILTTDVDLIINRNVVKAVSLVGNHNIGIVSCNTIHSVGGLLGFWRTAGHLLADRFGLSPGVKGLYALWRPYWLDSEDPELRHLENPRSHETRGSLALIGEDVYLRNSLRAKHRWIHLRDIGAYNMRDDFPDQPHVQFQLGRYYAELGYGLNSVLLRAIAFARPYLILGFLYQHRTSGFIPTPNYDTYPY